MPTIDTQQRRPDRPPTVKEKTLMLIVWLGLGVALCFTLLRGWVRLKYQKRFQLDDFLVIFAFLLLLASAIMYTIILKPMFTLGRVAAAQIPMPADVAAFTADTNLYIRTQFALTLAFWTCLWSVKASFLTFFYPLSNGLKWDRRLWYGVAAFTICGYIACVVSYPVSCAEFTVGTCQEEKNIDLSLVSLRMSTVLDIMSDIAIMIIPWKLLWVVKLSRKEKLAVGTIVGLGAFIVVFAIIRIIVTNTTGTHPEVVWLALWSAIETSVAVVVICMTSLKAFISKQGGSSSEYNNYGTSQHYNRSRSERGVKDGGTLRGAIPLDDRTTSEPFDAYKGNSSSVVRKHSSTNDSEEDLVR